MGLIAMGSTHEFRSSTVLLGRAPISSSRPISFPTRQADPPSGEAGSPLSSRGGNGFRLVLGFLLRRSCGTCEGLQARVATRRLLRVEYCGLPLCTPHICRAQIRSVGLPRLVVGVGCLIQCASAFASLLWDLASSVRGPPVATLSSAPRADGGMTHHGRSFRQHSAASGDPAFSRASAPCS